MTRTNDDVSTGEGESQQTTGSKSPLQSGARTTTERTVPRRTTLAALGGALGGSVLTALTDPLSIGRATGNRGPATDEGTSGLHETASQSAGYRGGWRQTGLLTPREGTTLFGGSVALGGGWLLVGATGKAVLYEATDGGWDRQRTFSRGPADGEFGSPVGLGGDGSVAAIGRPGADEEPGRVYVTERSGGSWGSLRSLTPDDATAGSNFGSSLDLSDDGDHLIVGASETGSDRTVRVFTRRSGGWVETGELVSQFSDGSSFGQTVAIDGSGDTAVVGVPFSHDNARDGGGVSVYERTASGWEHRFKTTEDIREYYFSGWAVALDESGSRAAVGSPVFYPKTQPGFVDLVERTDEGWEQTRRLRRPDERFVGNLGSSVTLAPDGRTVVSGDPRDTVGTVTHGSVSVFSMVEDQWGDLSKLLPDRGDVREYRERFGGAVSINTTATVTAVGASGRSTEGKGTGAVAIFERGVCSNPQPPSDETGIVDSFEDGNRAEYVALGGPFEDWAVQSTHAPAGEYALQYTGGAEPSDISSLQGLPRYPSRGDVFQFLFQPRGDWDFYTSFNFGQQPNSGFNNRYELELDPAEDGVRLQLDVPGTYKDEKLGQATVEFERDTTYTVEIDWEARGSQLVVTVRERGGVSTLGRIEASPPDDAPSSGGVGVFAHGEGDRWVYDGIRIIE